MEPKHRASIFNSAPQASGLRGIFLVHSGRLGVVIAMLNASADGWHTAMNVLRGAEHRAVVSNSEAFILRSAKGAF